MQTTVIINHISDWLKTYAQNAGVTGFVIGISGGIDSAVTSTIAAKTGLPIICLEMPIHQNKTQSERGLNHIIWLKKRFDNVTSIDITLSKVFDNFTSLVKSNKNQNKLALANTRARLRMTTLYYFAQINNSLVLGTGNKVEDFGIGFFTKYGDGGVDISPIADLLKTEIYSLGNVLGINNEILTAEPTDGLWGDEKTDEEQIGASYPELEWAMVFNGDKNSLTKRKKKVLEIYTNLNIANQHKMYPIPICKIPENIK